MKLSYTDKKSIILSEKLLDPITFLDSKKHEYVIKQVNKILWEELDFKSLFWYIDKLKRKYFLNKLLINTNEDIIKLNNNFNLMIKDIISYLNLNLDFDGLYSVQNLPWYTGITNIINNWLTTRELNEEKRSLLNKKSYFITSDKMSIPVYKTSLHKIIEGWVIFDISNENREYDKIFAMLNIIFSNLANEISSVFYLNNSILLKDAIIDPLTNVYKKEYFKWLLKSDLLALWENEKLILIFLDIDFFKKVNDTYGHNVWDFVLREFWNEIKKSIRDVDYIWRFGWEEFIIAMKIENNTDCNLDCKHCSNYKNIVKRLNNTLKNNILNNHILNKYKIKFSWWVSTSWEIDIEDINDDNILLVVDEFIEKADNNLYKAKEFWRNKICLTDWSFIE